MKSPYDCGAFNTCPQGSYPHVPYCFSKICLLKVLTDLVKSPSNFGVAAAPNNQVLRTCAASPGFAWPWVQTEFLLQLISHRWRCLNGPAPWWGRCSGQPCSHAALSTACLLHGAVFTEFSQKDSFRINLIE